LGGSNKYNNNTNHDGVYLSNVMFMLFDVAVVGWTVLVILDLVEFIEEWLGDLLKNVVIRCYGLSTPVESWS
jgi:hypothetical protein